MSTFRTVRKDVRELETTEGVEPVSNSFKTPVLLDHKEKIIAGYEFVAAARAEGRKDIVCVIYNKMISEAERKEIADGYNRAAKLKGMPNDITKKPEAKSKKPAPNKRKATRKTKRINKPRS